MSAAGETIRMRYNHIRQFAWLEFHEGIWHLITDLKAKTGQAGRNWIDKQAALAELQQEGWIVADKYPNPLSKKLDLGIEPRVYGLMRTIH